MECWLDWYAHEIAANYSGPNRSRGDPVRHFSEFTTEAVRYMKRPQAELDDSFHGEIAWFGRIIAPFGGHFFHQPPLAIAPSYHALATLDLEDVDTRAKDYGAEALAEHSTIYVDLCDYAYMLPGGVLQLRALFMWRCPEGNRFCGVVTRPGSNRGVRIAWLEGRHARSEHHRAQDQVYAMGSQDIKDPYRPINVNRLDYGELPQIEKLGWAILAYWRYCRDRHLPLMNAHCVDPLHLEALLADQPLMHMTDAPRVNESTSLFTLTHMGRIDLAPIRAWLDQNRRQDGSPKARHHVREFWRSQPCGRGRAERRLTKVKAHVRGRGLPRTSLHVMPEVLLDTVTNDVP